RDVQATERVIDGEGQLDEGASRQRGVRRWREQVTPPGGDLRILDDRPDVVEDERSGEAIRIDQATGQDDRRGTPPCARRRDFGLARGFDASGLFLLAPP